MAQFRNSLSHVKIAAPCTADWDQMFSFENDRVRFCSQCNLNVYNLSAMTQGEAAALVYRTEGRLCVRFHRRSDGTVLTQNCPVGLRAIKRRIAWGGQVLLGMLLGLFAGTSLYNIKPVRKLVEIFEPRPVIMGGLMRGPEKDEITLPDKESESTLQKNTATRKSSRASKK